jgi:tetratricopeptide (TPR) repeat protein
MRVAAVRRSGAALLLGLLVPARAFALDAELARSQVEKSISGVEASMVRGAPPVPAKLLGPSAAERIAAGEMLVRLKDSERAIDELSQILELYRQGKVSEAAHADASFLIAEAYFQSRQYLSARRHYGEVLDRSGVGAYQDYAGRSVSRLVDIALRTGDLDSLDDVVARLAKLPTRDRSGSLSYARAKAFIAKRDYSAAERALADVPSGSPYSLQSQYLSGVITLRKASTAGAAAAVAALNVPGGPAPEGPADSETGDKARYAPAIEQFRRVTALPAKTDSDQQVLDLAWMAVGRLSYEVSDYARAAEAYTHVRRSSPEFSTMLYELAWVYVRLGDFVRAQRALEVLSIMDPQTMEAADGSLLRADLMLRSGQFANSLALYRSVHAKFDPVRQQLEAFIASTSDPAAYYDKLTTDDRLSVDSQLSPLTIAWAREESEDEHVFGMIEDVSRSRALIKASRKLAAKLNAVLLVPTRVKAFPEVRMRVQYALELLNRLSKARLLLGQGLDDFDAESEELANVRKERRALAERMQWLPVNESEFAARDESGERQWNKVSQGLQVLLLEVDRLNAIVNGLRRVLKEADQHGVTSDLGSRERFRLEIDANERELASYRRQIDEYREAIVLGRAQSGFGDQRFVEDDEVRRTFRELLTRELQLLAAGQGGESARAFAREVAPLVSRLEASESKLEGQLRAYEQETRNLAADMGRKVSSEVAALETYARGLDALDQESRVLIGEVALKNFARVRDRLKSVVLRADVGIVQEAWESREEHRVRVRNLLRERSREEQNLNDELREVLEDAEDEK